MTGHRGISLTLATAAAAAAVLLGPPAAATGPATAAASPTAGVTSTEWRFIGRYVVHPMCAAAGQAGVQNGDWDDYICLPRLVGLDVMYHPLYVTP